MSPSALRKMTLKELRAARRTMLSARWTLRLEEADEETRASAGWELIRVNHAILMLENKRLAAMRDALLDNEQDLIKGTESLREALRDPSRLKEVMGAISGVLDVVGSVVSLL